MRLRTWEPIYRVCLIISGISYTKSVDTPKHKQTKILQSMNEKLFNLLDQLTTRWLAEQPLRLSNGVVGRTLDGHTFYLHWDRYLFKALGALSGKHLATKLWGTPTPRPAKWLEVDYFLNIKQPILFK